MTTYDHPKDEGSHKGIKFVWSLVDLGLICQAEAHMIMGEYFGYPPCCIAAFILDHPGGGLITDDRLGTYFHCNKCYKTREAMTWPK
jgi:hypothetical protein